LAEITSTSRLGHRSPGSISIESLAGRKWQLTQLLRHLGQGHRWV
jgi:hypothetical protein